MKGRSAAILGLPALLLLAPALSYWRYGGVPHFLLHTLVGWDVGLLILLTARLRDWSQRRWEGFLPVALALWAMGPDFIYVLGPYHRDWMDVFLFHVALDEILPYAVVVEAGLGVVLIGSYLAYGLPSAPSGSIPGEA